MENINSLYQQAPELAQKGERVVSIDELSGVQALERKHPGLAMRPGKVERREFEHIRHGTQSFIFSFDVAVGKILEATAVTPARKQTLPIIFGAWWQLIPK